MLSETHTPPRHRGRRPVTTQQTKEIYTVNYSSLCIPRQRRNWAVSSDNSRQCGARLQSTNYVIFRRKIPPDSALLISPQSPQFLTNPAISGEYPPRHMPTPWDGDRVTTPRVTPKCAFYVSDPTGQLKTSGCCDLGALCLPCPSRRGCLSTC